jgi:hypothetical protein
MRCTQLMTVMRFCAQAELNGTGGDALAVVLGLGSINQAFQRRDKPLRQARKQNPGPRGFTRRARL